MSKIVLVADDSVTIRKVFEMIFATEDFQLITVDNGLEAIALAKELRPDLLIADVTMPGKSGYEVCQVLKAEPSTRATHVVLLSGTFEAYDEALATSVGAVGHLTKPFESQAIIDKVRQWMGLPPAAAMPSSFGSSASTATATPVAKAPIPATSPGRPAIQVPSAPVAGLPSAGTNPGIVAPRTGQQPAMRPQTASPAVTPRSATLPGAPLRIQAPGAVPRAPVAAATPPGRSATVPAMPRQASAPAPRQRDPFGLAPTGPHKKVVRPNVPGESSGVMGDARPSGLGGMSLPDVGAPSVAPGAAFRSESDGGEALLREALSKASLEVIEKIAWEVVPQLAEAIIRENLERLIKERNA